MGRRHTLMAKNSVSPTDVKYAAVKGSRGPERRCCAYWTGPIKMAHDAKNKIEPMDHLIKTTATVSGQDRGVMVNRRHHREDRCSLNVVTE